MVGIKSLAATGSRCMESGIASMLVHESTSVESRGNCCDSLAGGTRMRYFARQASTKAQNSEKSLTTTSGL